MSVSCCAYYTTALRVAVPTTAPKHFVKGGDTKFYRYPREPECQRRWKLSGMKHDWAPTEHATITFSKNCPHITAVKVVVSVQLFPGLQLTWKKASENPHMTAGLTRCKDHQSILMLLELLPVRLCEQIFDKTIAPYAGMLGSSPSLISYLAVSTAAGTPVHEDTCRICVSTECFSAVVGTATHWHLQNSLKLYLLHSA